MVICSVCNHDVDKTYPKGEDRYGYPIMKCVPCIRKDARKGVLY